MLDFAEGGFPFRINSSMMFCVMGAEAVFIIILLWAASARKKKLTYKKIAKSQNFLEAGHKLLMLKKIFIALAGEPMRPAVRPAAFGGILGGQHFTPPLFSQLRGISHTLNTATSDRYEREWRKSTLQITCVQSRT